MTATDFLEDIEATRQAFREASELIDKQSKMIAELIAQLERMNAIAKDAVALSESLIRVASSCR